MIFNVISLVFHWNFKGNCIEISTAFPIDFIGISLKIQIESHWNVNLISNWLPLVICWNSNWISNGFHFNCELYLIEIWAGFPIDFHSVFIKMSIVLKFQPNFWWITIDISMKFWSVFHWNFNFTSDRYLLVLVKFQFVFNWYFNWF